MGKDLPVQGTWRNGYVELTLPCTWQDGKTQSTARMAGWIDGYSAQGRMEVEKRSDGIWTATKR
jgi:hypothetical protein